MNGRTTLERLAERGSPAGPERMIARLEADLLRGSRPVLVGERTDSPVGPADNRRGLVAIAAGFAVLVVLGGGWWLLGPAGSKPASHATQGPQAAISAGQVGVSEAPSNAGVPAGQVVSVGGWDVRVIGWRLDRGETGSNLAVLAVQLSAWFSGNDTSTLDDDLELAAVAASGRRYEPNFAKCDDGLEVYMSLQPDQSLQGFACFYADAGDAGNLVLELTPRDGSGEPVLMETISRTAQVGDDFGPEEVVEALIDTGVQAFVVESPYERSGMIPGATKEWVLCLDGQESQLYEYATEDLRRTVSGTIQRTVNPENAFIDLPYGRLMWWAKGRVLINYNFADPTLSERLSLALGQTISPQGTQFGDPPDPLPASELCGFGE